MFHNSWMGSNQLADAISLTNAIFAVANFSKLAG
ncbi:hypothetical protein N836_25760 [Leptolyngbya sp. Heron Island J]|nr:hypothetical protein N836_25760 [Leptolyngbya sp. Heron Island J]